MCGVYAPARAGPAVFLYHLPPYFLGTEFLPELEVQLFQWAGWAGRPWDALSLCSSAGLQAGKAMPGFLCECSDSNAGITFAQ